MIIQDFLVQDGKSKDLAILIEKCTTHTCFLFQGKYFKQMNGTLVGSPPSPIVADIFLESLEEVALQSFYYKSKSWFRYVDNNFII